MRTPLDLSVSRLTVPVSEVDHVLGDAAAPVTVVEYGDYQCPYCRRAHPVVQDLLNRRSDVMRLVFRHFPLSNVHPYAQQAAEAAEAAGAQGRFWAMHDRLFEHQPAIDPGFLLASDVPLGLDGAAYRDAVTGGSFRDKVQQDFIGGLHSGVNGTPTFFVGGIRFDGPHTVADLSAAVDAAFDSHAA